MYYSEKSLSVYKIKPEGKIADWSCILVSCQIQSRFGKSRPPLCIFILEVPRDQILMREMHLSMQSCPHYEAANPGQTELKPQHPHRAGSAARAPQHCQGTSRQRQRRSRNEEEGPHQWTRAMFSKPTRERTKGIVLKQVHMFLTSFRLAIGHSHTTASCKGLFSLNHHSFASWQNNRHRELPRRGPAGHSWSVCSSLSFLTFAISYTPAMDQMHLYCNSAEVKQGKEHTTTLLNLFEIRWISNRVAKIRFSTCTPLPRKGLVTAPGFSSSPLFF